MLYKVLHPMNNNHKKINSVSLKWGSRGYFSSTFKIIFKIKYPFITKKIIFNFIYNKKFNVLLHQYNVIFSTLTARKMIT